MKRQDIFCDYCDSESTVETTNIDYVLSNLWIRS
jgi:hypothetical protein